MHLSSDLALDEGESLVAVDVDVLLVVVGVVSVAAVRIGRIAVALDDAGVGGRALESLWTSGESLSCTCSNVIRKASAVVRVAHEDSSLDSGEGIATKSRSRTTAESVVHDLTTL